MRRLLLGAVGVVMVAPFFYMLSVSFMGEAELLRWPPPLLPSSPTTDNYAAALAALPYTRVLLNTAILAGCVMIGQVLTSAAAGYAFLHQPLALEAPVRLRVVLTVFVAVAVLLAAGIYLVVHNIATNLPVHVVSQGCTVTGTVNAQSEQVSLDPGQMANFRTSSNKASSAGEIAAHR